MIAPDPRVTAATAVLADVAATVRLLAARVEGRSHACAWEGPARRDHDRRATAVGAELRGLAALLLELADDAAGAATRQARTADVVPVGAAPYRSVATAEAPRAGVVVTATRSPGVPGRLARGVLP